MKKFLIKKLFKEEKLKLEKPSLEISESYLIKSKNSLLSSKILFKNKLIEDSFSMAYFSMYNSLLSLLFRVGIKCENHSFSIFLLNKLFFRKDLLKIISYAKRQRIDKQYYVESNNEKNLFSENKSLIKLAENFNLKIREIINSLNEGSIVKIRKEFLDLK